jgi:hypothetical protein
MRIVLVASLAAVALAACANGRDRTEAALSCENVGIAKGDPDYDFCQQAYVASQREDALNTNYRTTLFFERSLYRRNPER